MFGGQAIYDTIYELRYNYNTLFSGYLAGVGVFFIFIWVGPGQATFRLR